jgi:hypothetical protein
MIDFFQSRQRTIAEIATIAWSEQKSGAHNYQFASTNIYTLKTSETLME